MLPCKKHKLLGEHQSTQLQHTQEAGGYRGNGAIPLVATLLGSSCLIPLLSLCFLLSLDLALSIRAACILASFVAVWTARKKLSHRLRSVRQATRPKHTASTILQWRIKFLSALFFCNCHFYHFMSKVLNWTFAILDFSFRKINTKASATNFTFISVNFIKI